MYTNSLFYGISKIKARKHKWVTLLSLIKCAETKAMACTYDKQIFCSYLKLWVQILSILKEERCSCTHCTSLISNRALSNPIQGLLQHGHITHSKNFKTPFFWRYFNVLPVGNSDGSKISPKFFFLKNFKKQSC